jgi:hypothetical protein
MKKTILILAIALMVISCKKETKKVTIWECNLGNGTKGIVVSDTMPIVKSINEFGLPIVCDCYKK